MSKLYDKTGFILGKLQETSIASGFSTVPLVAGGFVRDILLQREPRDADIYWRKSGTMTGDKVQRAALIDLGLTRLTAGGYATAGKISEMWTNKDKDVEVMLTTESPFETVASSFDIGLCMCAMDAHGVVYTSDVFDEDLEYRRLTFHCRGSLSTYQIGKSMTARREKLMKKFPTHGWHVKYSTPETRFVLRYNKLY